MPAKSLVRTSAASRPQDPQANAAQDLEVLARWMDSVFEIPGLRLRFGLDALLGLLPGAGDLASSLAAIYILSAANRYGVARITLVRMTLNILVDVVVGALPIVGDIFDVYWKSNQRNVELLRRHIAAAPGAERKMRFADLAFVAMLIGLVCLLTAGTIVLAYFALAWVADAIRHTA
jgi:Domain of unknown function (DUF4112)